jgi:hypothetical protein
MLKSVATVLLAVQLVAATLDQCKMNQGYSESWITYKVEKAYMYGIGHGGSPEGDNFCFSPIRKSRFQTATINMYADMTCIKKKPPTKKAASAPKPGECANADTAIPLCSNVRHRLLARLVAQTAGSAPEFAKTYTRLLGGPRSGYAVVVLETSRFTPGMVVAQAYTDDNICVIRVTGSKKVDYRKFVVAVAKLDKLPAGVTNNEGARLTALKTAAAPAANDACKNQMAANPGIWGSLFVNEGVEKAALVGDTYIGENSCFDISRTKTMYALNYYMKNDLECDDTGAPVSALAKQAAAAAGEPEPEEDADTNMYMVTTVSKPSYPLNRCNLDGNAEECMDSVLRNNIRKVISHDKTNDPHVVAKKIQAYMPEGGNKASIVVIRLANEHAYRRMARSDFNLCLVARTNRNKVNFLVYASKLDFNA